MSNTEESGKSKRGKGWEALENVEYMKAISKLARSINLTLFKTY